MPGAGWGRRCLHVWKRRWDNVAAQRAGASELCGGKLVLLCSFSSLHKGDGNIFAEGFHPALAQSSYSLQVPFKPEVKNVLKPTAGWGDTRLRRKIPFAFLQSVELVVYFGKPE